MNGVNRRIVVLRDIHSNLIEEAILVLRNEPDNGAVGGKKTDGLNVARDKDFLLKEAETIINSYVEHVQKQENKDIIKHKKKKSFKRQFTTNLIINSALAGSILLLIIFLRKLL